MLGNSFSRDLREQLMDDCAYALGELYSSGCLFLVEGDSDQKVYQAVIDFILGKPGGPLRISALSPKESYLEGIDYLFFSCYREYSISPEPAVDLLKNGKEGRGCGAVAAFLLLSGNKQNCFGIADRDFMLKDKRFSRCLKKPFLTDACDLESTILSASPNLLEMAVAVLLGKKTLDEQCRFNVNKALMLSYESGLVRISEDATTNDDFGTDSVAIYYREVIDYQYSYPFFDFEGGTFLLEKWLALVVEKAKISNGKNRWGYQYDADFWSASFKDFLNERGAIIEDSNHRCVWNQPFLEKQMSKGFSRGAEGCQQFWRFVNGHMLAYFIGKTTKNNLIKCDKLKKYKYGEWTLEDSIADTFKENSQFIKEFVDQTQVAHQIRDALKSLPYICI